MAIFSLMKASTPPGVGAACVRLRFPHHTCDACQESCPVQAITLAMKSATLDSDACIRCGHCLFACPVDALENLIPPQRARRGTSLVAPFSSLAASVDELLMWHIQFGIRAVELEMEEHPGWALAVASLNIRLRALHEPLWQILPPAAKSVSVLRRRWLRVNEVQVESDRVAPSLRLRRKALASFSEYGVRLKALECIVCGACERVCDQNAIAFDGQEMTLRPERCTGCNNCVVVCPTKAIMTEKEISECEPVTLRYLQKQCSGCQSTFSTFNAEDRRCPTCQRHTHGMRL